MTLFDQDLRFLKESEVSLQEYLLSNELYWPLSASLPRLTPGSLLLALACCRVSAPVEAQKVFIQIEIVQKKWPTAWGKKATREITNRLRLWSEFLSDYLKAPDQDLESYRTEARGRTILQLLLVDIPEPQAVKALADLDDVVKTHLLPCEFLWEPELQPVFPKSDFWFLYGNL